MSYERRGGRRCSSSHSDAELRKVLAGVRRGAAIHPGLSDLLIHLGYLERRPCGLHLTLKAYRLVGRKAKPA
ncbi:hypothetical protein [Pseudomonas sp. SCB32]|uniref:hypothetical protein n=1 Tax=Pseudomonas sp. SCB32 TaxID=2653853 RepID=UPI001264D19F|nr:hypothetical protein [Pseudomonas sp. SCB32]